MRRFFGSLICKLPRWTGGGHRRGRRTASVYDAHDGVWLTAYQCPRCWATWSRKIKPAPASNIPTSIKKAAP